MGIEPTRSLSPDPSPVLKTGGGTSLPHAPVDRTDRILMFADADSEIKPTPGIQSGSGASAAGAARMDVTPASRISRAARFTRSKGKDSGTRRMTLILGSVLIAWESAAVSSDADWAWPSSV